MVFPEMVQDDKIVIVSLPKSGTMYVKSEICNSLGYEPLKITTDSPFFQKVNARDLERFMSLDKVISVGHMNPMDFNINCLRLAGINKLALLVRDPRETIISYFHHLERADIRESRWIYLMLVSEKIIPLDYYNLTQNEKIDELIKGFYALSLDWLNGWKKVMETESFLKIHISDHKDLASNSDKAVGALLRYFGYSYKKPHAFNYNKKLNGIDLVNHFRKGESGKWKSQLSSDQVIEVNSYNPRDVFSFYGWPLEN